MIERVEGIEVRTVRIDPDRAHHVQWAFEQYATGEHSIGSLRKELEERGFKSRTTRKIVGKPINNGQLHRLLTNPYYKGFVLFNGAMYAGAHEPLVDDVTWQRVQDILATRRIAGDRSWRHQHYLKGALRCARCGSRMGFAPAKGKSEEYDYFYCIARHTSRTQCDLPYLSVIEVEEAIERRWSVVRFSDDQIEAFSKRARGDLHRSAESRSRLIVDQRRRLAELERHRQKLLDAFMIDAVSVEVLKQRQTQVEAEIADAKRLIANAQTTSDEVFARLEQVIALLTHADRLYASVGEEARELLNSAVFGPFDLDFRADAEGEGAPGERPTPATSARVAATAAFTAPVGAVLGDGAAVSPTGRARTGSATGEGGDARTPAGLMLGEGSNVSHLAEVGGFEPPRALTQHGFQPCAIGH
ncbi:hypothetical protein GCM10027215_09420 [Nocardioides zeae]